MARGPELGQLLSINSARMSAFDRALTPADQNFKPGQYSVLKLAADLANPGISFNAHPALSRRFATRDQSLEDFNNAAEKLAMIGQRLNEVTKPRLERDKSLTQEFGELLKEVRREEIDRIERALEVTRQSAEKGYIPLSVYEQARTNLETLKGEESFTPTDVPTSSELGAETGPVGNPDASKAFDFEALQARSRGHLAVWERLLVEVKEGRANEDLLRGVLWPDNTSPILRDRLVKLISWVNTQKLLEYGLRLTRSSGEIVLAERERPLPLPTNVQSPKLEGSTPIVKLLGGIKAEPPSGEAPRPSATENKEKVPIWEQILEFIREGSGELISYEAVRAKFWPGLDKDTATNRMSYQIWIANKKIGEEKYRITYNRKEGGYRANTPHEKPSNTKPGDDPGLGSTQPPPSPENGGSPIAGGGNKLPEEGSVGGIRVLALDGKSSAAEVVKKNEGPPNIFTIVSLADKTEIELTDSEKFILMVLNAKGGVAPSDVKMKIWGRDVNNSEVSSALAMANLQLSPEQLKIFYYPEGFVLESLTNPSGRPDAIPITKQVEITSLDQLTAKPKNELVPWEKMVLRLMLSPDPIPPARMGELIHGDNRPVNWELIMRIANKNIALANHAVRLTRRGFELEKAVTAIPNGNGSKMDGFIPYGSGLGVGKETSEQERNGSKDTQPVEIKPEIRMALDKALQGISYRLAYGSGGLAGMTENPASILFSSLPDHMDTISVVGRLSPREERTRIVEMFVVELIRLWNSQDKSNPILEKVQRDLTTLRRERHMTLEDVLKRVRTHFKVNSPRDQVTPVQPRFRTPSKGTQKSRRHSYR